MNHKKVIKCILIVGILFHNLFLFGQKIDSSDVKVKKVKILPVPAFGYEPETKTHIVAVCLFTLDFYQDSTTRKSNAKLEFNYTFRNQIILYKFESKIADKRTCLPRKQAGEEIWKFYL